MRSETSVMQWPTAQVLVLRASLIARAAPAMHIEIEDEVSLVPLQADGFQGVVPDMSGGWVGFVPKRQASKTKKTPRTTKEEKTCEADARKRKQEVPPLLTASDVESMMRQSYDESGRVDRRPNID